MVTTIPLKGKNIVQIGNSRGIIIDASYFSNGLLTENDIVDVIIKVVGKQEEED